MLILFIASFKEIRMTSEESCMGGEYRSVKSH
jgi:hypothetical protein